MNWIAEVRCRGYKAEVLYTSPAHQTPQTWRDPLTILKYREGVIHFRSLAELTGHLLTSFISEYLEIEASELTPEQLKEARGDLINGDLSLHFNIDAEERVFHVIELLIARQLKITLKRAQSLCTLTHCYEAVTSIYEGYETQQIFDHVDEFSRDLASLNQFFSKHKESKISGLSVDESPAVSSFFQNRIVNIGVIGASGSGKSTYLNALIGHNLLPTDTDICTASPTIISYGEDEYAEVSLLAKPLRDELYNEIMDQAHAHLELLLSCHLDDSDSAYQSLYNLVNQGLLSRGKRLLEIARRKIHNLDKISSAEVMKLHERTLELIHKVQDVQTLRMLEPRLAESENPLRVDQFNSLKRYISRNPRDYKETPWHLIVTHVNVYLQLPLLKHINLVDIAGFGDFDARRMRETCEVIKTLNGWMLMSSANVRDFQRLEEFISVAQDLSGLPYGLINFTKLDTLLSDGELRSHDELLAERVERAKLNSTESGYSSARLATLLPKVLPSDNEQLEQMIDQWIHDPFLGSWCPRLNIKLSRQSQRAYEDGFYIVDQHTWQAYRDLNLDISGVVYSISTLNGFISNRLITQYLSDSRKHIHHITYNRIRRYRREMERNRTRYYALLERRNLNDELKEVKAKVKKLKLEVDEAYQVIHDEISELRSQCTFIDVEFPLAALEQYVLEVHEERTSHRLFTRTFQLNLTHCDELITYIKRLRSLTPKNFDANFNLHGIDFSLQSMEHFWERSDTAKSRLSDNLREWAERSQAEIIQAAERDMNRQFKRHQRQLIAGRISPLNEEVASLKDQESSIILQREGLNQKLVGRTLKTIDDEYAALDAKLSELTTLRLTFKKR